MRLHALARSAVLAGTVLLASSAAAQRNKEPKRPKMPAAADTNDARAYYDFALAELQKDPEKAADALYWSTKLEPLMADYFYARRIALLMSDDSRLERYWFGDRRTVQSDEVKRIDSLYYHALTLNPFVSQMLDRQLYERVAQNIADRIERTSGASSSEVRFVIDRQMASAPASVKAWLAYGDGRFGDALDLYARAIQDDKRNGPLHNDRGRIFFQTNRPDSALSEMTAAIEDMRKRDKKELVYVYQSKALTEHSIGVIHQRLGHADAAKEAFQRALQEDLSYYPAHLQLAFMALEAKDTTTALSEMDLAVQLRADDAASHFLYGFTLMSAGKAADAEPQLRKAIELNPAYAAPWFSLAKTLEALKRPVEAVSAYWEFLERAARSDLRRGDARDRVAALANAKSGER